MAVGGGGGGDDAAPTPDEGTLPPPGFVRRHGHLVLHHNLHGRRLRKNLSLPEQCTPGVPVRWWDWVNAPKYLRGPPEMAVPWLVGALFAIGSILFAISGVADCFPSYVAPGQGWDSAYTWLNGAPVLVGANLCFFPAGASCPTRATLLLLLLMMMISSCCCPAAVAGLLVVYESLNAGYSCQLELWKQRGAKGPPPRRRNWGWAPERISWWAAVIQVGGGGLASNQARPPSRAWRRERRPR